MDPRASDTMPLPVVETVVAPAVPPPTNAMPAEAPLPASSRRRRDLTPMLLGLLALAAVVALALSMMAFARNDATDTPKGPDSLTVPASPAGGLATEAPATTAVPTTLAPATTSIPSTTASPAPTRTPVATAPEPGSGKGGGKGGKRKP